MKQSTWQTRLAYTLYCVNIVMAWTIGVWLVALAAGN